jgi:WD40 repeat protein
MSESGAETGLFVSVEARNGPGAPDETTELIRKHAFGRPANQLTPDKLAVYLRDLQRQRWKLGVKVSVEDLLREHPSLLESPELFTLIYGEFVLREEHGETPTLDDYGERFPDLTARLERQIKLHRMMESASGLVRRPKMRVTEPPIASPASPDKPWPEVEGYEILGELGRGGMGVVYRAHQLGLNRIVALKMVLGGPFANATFQARFRSEAEVIARMQHPNIVQVFAIGIQTSKLGQAFGCPYFSQEFVDGGSLETNLGGKPRPAAAAAQMIETLARAVHYAHEQGVVHRDLKSANILLTAQGVPKISDFGLAKQLDNPAGETIQGTIMGTPEYMAPEQAMGQTDIGPPADIYALGVILYELVTGRPPFQGPTLDVLTQVRTREPMPLGLLQTGTPRDLETICHKCLRKEPRLRYASARELAEDLRRFQRGEPILARPVGKLERCRRWAVRHPAVALLTILAIVLAVGGSLGITAAWLHALAGWSAADSLRDQAMHRQAEAEARREQAEAMLYFNRIAQANLERRSDNIHSAEALLDACVPTGGGLDRRGWEWHYLKSLQHADLLTIAPAQEEFVADMSISPDGQFLASGGGTPFLDTDAANTVRIWALTGSNAGKRLANFPQSSMVCQVVFRPGGRSLAWVGIRGQVGVIDLATGQASTPWKMPEGYKTIVLNRDGSRLAALNASEHQVKIWDTDSHQELRRFSNIRAQDSAALVFDPTGQRVAILSSGIMGLWEIASGTQVQSLPVTGQSLGKPVFSDDGKLLAYGTESGLVRIWDLTRGEMVHSLSGHAGSVNAVAFAPGGAHIASAGADQTVRLWNLAEGVELVRFRGHQGRASCLTFPASGRYLASGSEQPGEIKLWDLTRQQDYISVTPNARAARIIEGLSFSQDGESIQLLRKSGALQVADATSGVERKVARLNFGGPWRVPAALAAFSGGGRLLAHTSRADGKMVDVVDLATGQTLHHLQHNAEVLHIAMSRDGQTLATSAHDYKNATSRREVRVWNVASGALQATIRTPPFFTNHIFGSVALSDDGSLLAYDEYVPTGEQPPEEHVAITVHIRDLATGQTIRSLDRAPSLVRCLAFSPDARFLAVGCELGGVYVYDRQTDRWQPDQPLTGSAFDSFVDLSYNPDGRRLAAAGHLQVQMWDARTGSPVLALRGAPPRPKDVGFNPRLAWSPDGRRLAASHWNGTASIWDSADRHTPDATRASLR